MSRKLQKGELFGYTDRRAEKVCKKPHISLWRTNPPPHKFYPDKGYKKNQDWYVSLDWEQVSDIHILHFQVDIFDWMFYNETRKKAIEEGKKYNIPVIKHMLCQMVVIWAPTEETTEEQKNLLKEFQKGDE